MPYDAATIQRTMARIRAVRAVATRHVQKIRGMITQFTRTAEEKARTENEKKIEETRRAIQSK
ncbi:MAG: hypothetical protein Q7S16_04405 [bacterium]|nr:hypothetical protein [bacterium]